MRIATQLSVLAPRVVRYWRNARKIDPMFGQFAQRKRPARKGPQKQKRRPSRLDPKTAHTLYCAARLWSALGVEPLQLLGYMTLPGKSRWSWPSPPGAGATGRLAEFLQFVGGGPDQPDIAAVVQRHRFHLTGNIAVGLQSRRLLPIIADELMDAGHLVDVVSNGAELAASTTGASAHRSSRL
jgi:hypothetical protein